jgi:hypothetical protein
MYVPSSFMDHPWATRVPCPEPDEYVLEEGWVDLLPPFEKPSTDDNPPWPYSVRELLELDRVNPDDVADPEDQREYS